ncbi:MAG: CCDC90 family protein [Rhodoferax sp.]|nr:CCDC90 family protein [Rhodoferax sp.]
MSSITFDTLKYVKQLEASGIPAAQAEAFVNAQREIMADALDASLATRADFHSLEKALHSDVERIDRKLVEHDGRFMLLQWMIGFNLAFTMAVLWKVFS